MQRCAANNLRMNSKSKGCDSRTNRLTLQAFGQLAIFFPENDSCGKHYFPESRAFRVQRLVLPQLKGECEANDTGDSGLEESKTRRVKRLILPKLKLKAKGCSEEIMNEESDSDLIEVEVLSEEAILSMRENSDADCQEVQQILNDIDKEDAKRSHGKGKNCEMSVCYRCGKLIQNKYYDRHFRTHQFDCMHCNESFGTKKKLIEHSEVHDQKDDCKFECPTCGSKYSNPIAYAYHCQKHTSLGVFKCPMCTFQTNSKTSLKPHVKRFHQQDFKVICEICGRGFLNYAAHADHLRLHAGEKKFNCEYCDKKFVLYRYLDIHKKLNHKDIINGIDEAYECNICSRQFKFEKSLVRHLSCIHNIGENRRVPCSICNKVLANNYGLKMHMLTHTGEKPFKCQHCDNFFAKRKYLQKHMLRAHPETTSV